MAGLPDPMTRWGVRVFDGHAHFPYIPAELLDNPNVDPLNGSLLWGDWSAQYLRRFGREKHDLLKRRNDEGQRSWWRAYNFPEANERPASLDETVRRWQAELDKKGIDGVVFMTGGNNDALARVAQADPRFVGFAHHDPFQPGAATELRRAVAMGLRGYKILAPAINRPLDDPVLDELWSVCEEHHLPVVVHFGPLGGRGGLMTGPNISPLRLHDVAKGFPTVPFIVPHFGCGYVKELIHLMWGCENVVVDTSGNNDWRRFESPPLSLKALFTQFRDLFGAQRIIFGTDSSHFPRGFATRYLDDQLRVARECGFDEGDVQAVFGENMRRLLAAVRL